MQGKGPDFIPTKSGKKGEILRKVGYKESDIYRYKASFFENQKINRKKVKVTNTQSVREYWQEIAINIMNDGNLSQSYGNPEWYPPVPKYKIPEGKASIPQKTNTGIQQLTSENFATSWLHISNTPMTLEEFEAYQVETFRYTKPQTFYTHHQTIKTIEGYTVQKQYSYPNIIDRIKYYVTFVCSENGSELLGIYCYGGKKAIEELTGFLAETPVANEGEKNEAIVHLSKIHQKIP